MPSKGPFFYDTSLKWLEGKAGVINGAGLPTVSFGAPKEFGGAENTWTPEHFYVAAAETCLMNTFLAIAEASKMGVMAYTSEARGKLEWVEGSGYRMTEIQITPHVLLFSESDVDKATRLMSKAEHACLVGRSMTATISVSMKVAAVGEPAA